MISGISFASLPKINFTGRSENPISNNLERSPKRDTVNFGSNIYAPMSPERREELENTVYEFKMGDGSDFKGTVKEFLEASMINWNRTDYLGTIYHVPSSTDVGEQILKEGLDWTKNGRSQAGPGTYFSPSLACGEFSGLGYKAIEAAYNGNNKEYPIMEKGFYDRLTDAVPITRKEYHELMTKDLGVDILYSGTGRAGGAYVVLKDDCVRLKKGW